MKHYQFKGLLTNDGWLENAIVGVDEHGLINEINPPNAEKIESIDGLALPGFQNAHSHAFQYAMAGLAERHKNAAETDDFWGWRETMYQIALTMSPDDLEAIATMLYSEMVRHGYTHVAEFHYLHHDKNGKPYQNLAEHGERLVAAAKTAGIKITLVPMFYQMGGFGHAPQPRQRRFISATIEDYYNLLEASQNVVNQYTGANCGFGVHSLRAVQANDITALLNNKNLNGPFHIHIAEQLKEIEDCKAFYGQRPVEWLMANAPVDRNYHLVHATHLTDAEVSSIAQSGAHVVLCPTTEGNLGDGIFKLRDFQQRGGRWSIGTDSHISLNPLEELRLLDYGQRLISHRRNTFVDLEQTDSGAFAIAKALHCGRAAMGNDNEAYFGIGQPLDAVIYKANTPLLATATKDNWLSTLVYAADTSWNMGTMINGQWVVQTNNHRNRENIEKRFVHAIKGLGIR